VTPVNLGNGAGSFGSMIHPAVEVLGTNVRVLVEQTTAAGPRRLGDLAGRLSPEELMEINVALRAYSTWNSR
jgi:mRNA-degrading endonuclease toxin of MazEF toxin-antitoxin module